MYIDNSFRAFELKDHREKNENLKMDKVVYVLWIRLKKEHLLFLMALVPTITTARKKMKLTILLHSTPSYVVPWNQEEELRQECCQDKSQAAPKEVQEME